MPGRRFFSLAELDSLQRTAGAMDPWAYHLRAPMAQFLAVSCDAPPGDGVCVRTTTLCPMTWEPYSLAISFPLGDERVIRNLSAPGAECVLAEPTRDQLREAAICSQRAPDGICEAEIAGLKLCRSHYVSVPSIDSCPANLECVVEHVERYHAHLIVFVRVVGRSIDDVTVFKAREAIVQTYPTNYVDDVFDANGNVRRRVSVLRDIHSCPTFPYAPKCGWGTSFSEWMTDLRDEGYLSEAECRLLLTWVARWEQVFTYLDSPERNALRSHLTEASRLIVRGEWAQLHAHLSEAAHG